MADGGGLDTPEVEALLAHLERMAGGETGLRVPLDGLRSDFDALAYGINALVSELDYARVRLARESAAKSTFLRTLSHECRTPLTAILSIAELLARDAISEQERREYGDRLARNVRGLLSVLDEVLDLARLEAGAHVLDRKRVALGALARDVVSCLAALGEAKGLAVRCEGDEDLEVDSDARRLRQILVNLVGNAIKFTARGEVVVSLSPVAGGDGAIIDVSDTGIGIAPDAQDRLFEVFQQGEADIAARFGGSGLGLAVSRRFAEALGGSLRLVRSEPGRGSVFRLYVPHGGATAATAEPARANDGVVATLAPSAGPISIAGMHVLVAEDNEDIRELIRAVLESEGAKVSLVGDGLAATEAALRLEPHVVLMDLAMPRMNGHSAAAGLRAAGYARPILCLTAHVSDEPQDEPSPFDDHLVKPLEIDDLLRKLAEHGRRG